MYCCMCGRDLTEPGVLYELAGLGVREYICYGCLEKIRGGREGQKHGERYTVD